MNIQFKIEKLEKVQPIYQENNFLLVKLKALTDKAISVELIDNFNNIRKDTDVSGLKFENENDTIIYFWNGIPNPKLQLQVIPFSYLFCYIKNGKVYLHNALNNIFSLDPSIKISVIKMLAQVMNIKMCDCIKNIVWVENPIVINNEDLESKSDDLFVYTCNAYINQIEENFFSKIQESEITKLIKKVSDYGFRFVNLNLLDKYQYPAGLTIATTKHHGFITEKQIIICEINGKICVANIKDQDETIESKANGRYIYDMQSKINNDIPMIVQYVFDKYVKENALLMSNIITGRDEFLKIMGELYDKIDMYNKDNNEKRIWHHNQMVENISLLIDQHTEQIVL